MRKSKSICWPGCTIGGICATDMLILWLGALNRLGIFDDCSGSFRRSGTGRI